MGAVIDLPRTCAPFTLEVRSGGSVYIGDGPATVLSNEGRPITGSALRARGRGEVTAGQPIPTLLEWSVGAEHLDAFARVLTQAARHLKGRRPRGVNEGQPVEPSGSTAHRAPDGSLVVSGGTAWSYGMARDVTWEQACVVEVMWGDLPVLAAALAERVST